MGKKICMWGFGVGIERAMEMCRDAGIEVLAVLDRAPTVSAAHVRQAAPYVLRHRVIPNYNATGEGITAQQIVEKVLAEIREPDYR